MSSEQISQNQAAETPADQPEPAAATFSPLSADSLLDEIDAMLEENPAEFVRSFVQKGGE